MPLAVAPPRVQQVKVTMLLADSAQVAEGKLYILGGGWSLIGPDPAPSAVAIKLELDWHETDRMHHWELFLEDADGQPVTFMSENGLESIEIRGELSAMRPEGLMEGTPVDIPMAINLGPLPIEPGNRFTWKFLLDGEAIEGGSIGFTTRPVIV